MLEAILWLWLLIGLVCVPFLAVWLLGKGAVALAEMVQDVFNWVFGH